MPRVFHLGILLSKNVRAVCRYHLLRTVFCTSLAVLFLPLPGTASASTKASFKLVCKWDVPVTPPTGGHLNWYELRADPESDANLIVCGAVRDAQKNAYLGVVYVSHDHGRSWRMALEDRGSTWVSEQSCAFGTHHTVFFISEASKVMDGVPHHSLGTTHIFLSRDAGETWTKTADTSWADYSSAVVSQSAAGEQQLHVVYNSAEQEDPGKHLGSVLGFFLVSTDGRSVTGPKTVPGMAKLDYRGVYPSSSVALNDGTTVSLYNAGTRRAVAKGGISLELGIVRFHGEEASPPIIVADPLLSYESPVCPSSISNSLAYNRQQNRLYLAYNTLKNGRCALMLRFSGDGGRSWSKARELVDGTDRPPARYFPILAVNNAGTLGLMWRGRADLTPGCWFFSTSHDAIRIDATVPLAPCAPSGSVGQQSSQFLATLTEQASSGQPALLRVLTLRDYLTRVSFAASTDGAFHPVWSQVSNEGSELRSVQIRPAGHHDDTQSGDLPKFKDVTDQVAILFAGQQRLDHVADRLTVDLAVENRGPAALRGHLFLQLEDVKSDFGEVEIGNSHGRPLSSTRYLDLTPYLPREGLKPGHATAPYPLVFHYLRTTQVLPGRAVLGEVKIRVLGDPRTVGADVP
jgi:hypothetical protein